MTEFTPGDRVRYVGTSRPGWGGREGVVIPGSDGVLAAEVLFDDSAKILVVQADDLVKINLALSGFVGRRPRVLPPLKFSGDRSIVDDAGRKIGEIYTGPAFREQDGELAGVIVTLLNKHFGVDR